MFLKRFAPWVVVAILAWFFIISLVVSRQESTTMDEKAHIPSAYTYMRYGDMRLNPEHPPLLKDLAGLPLLLLSPAPVFPLTDPLWTQGVNEQWVLGDKLLHEFGNNADAITFWSRVPIIFIGLLLGWFIFIWTKELAGAVAGLFALLLYAFDPNILGHSHYVTTDLGIAAAIFMSVYFFVRFLKAPSGHNVLLSGLFLGVAQLTKFSAVLLFPLFGLFVLLYPLVIYLRPEDRVGHSPFGARFFFLLHYVLKFAGSVAVCFILIWAVYTLNTLHMPAEKIQDVAKIVFSNEGLNLLAKNIVISMSEWPALKGLSEYFLGVFMVFVRVTGGNTYYFLGNVSNHASPAYFPIVFLLKETLPFLFLMLVAASWSLRRIWIGFRHHTAGPVAWIRRGTHHHIASIVMLSFVALYSYLSITGNLNIGFRHLFPILPFLYVLTAKSLFDWARHFQGRTPLHQNLFQITGALMVLWIIIIPVAAFPSYLSYFNETAGGPSAGYKYVTDSNYDWGQDLKRLRIWVDEYNHCLAIQAALTPECLRLTDDRVFPTDQPITHIRIDYFGGSSPSYYFGGAYIPWHGENAPSPGWYAISAGFFQESIHKNKNSGEPSYAWLARYPMLARAGDSIFIFYVPEE